MPDDVQNTAALLHTHIGEPLIGISVSDVQKRPLSPATYFCHRERLHFKLHLSFSERRAVCSGQKDLYQSILPSKPMSSAWFEHPLMPSAL